MHASARRVDQIGLHAHRLTVEVGGKHVVVQDDEEVAREGVSRRRVATEVDPGHGAGDLGFGDPPEQGGVQGGGSVDANAHEANLHVVAALRPRHEIQRGPHGEGHDGVRAGDLQRRYVTDVARARRRRRGAVVFGIRAAGQQGEEEHGRAIAGRREDFMGDAAVVTCALTGVLTDPRQFPVPVTAQQMAAEARRARDAGATVVHLHYRRQERDMGHLPTWEPDVVGAIVDAIRGEVPDLLINSSTGVLGPDLSGPIGALHRARPEIAALNAGTLNYLKVRSDGSWAWPPLIFDNPVEKVEAFVVAMRRLGIRPECECFDTGIVRSLALYLAAGLLEAPIHASFVMGVASGMPCDPAWLPLLVRELPRDAHFQTIGIGRAEVWAVHRRCAELGGDVRTGLEDTMYLPDGARAASNGDLVEALVDVLHAVGRRPATPAEARAAYALTDSPRPSA